MKTISSYRTQAKKDAEAILKDGIKTVESLETILSTHFPHGPADLATVTTNFETDLSTNGLDAANSLLSTSIPAARDALALCVSHVQTLERFIALHVPQMEDGNNFGVTVQLTVSKHLKETREEWNKKLGEIPGYYKARAEAVEKLGLPKTSTTETKTSSQSESTGGKDGDENKTSKSTVNEEKTSNGSKTDVHAVKHIVALDVQWYQDLRAVLVELLGGYMVVLDNMEKNGMKLEAPKGSSNAMSMF